MGFDAGPGQLEKMKAAAFTDVVKTDPYGSFNTGNGSLTHMNMNSHELEPT